MHEAGFAVAAVGSPPLGASSVSARAAAVAWPVRSGAMPRLVDKFSTRPESAPSIEMALNRSAIVALTSGGQAGRPAPEWVGSCGKTQLAAYIAESQWHARAIDLLVWIDASSRASVLCGYVDAVVATTGVRPVGPADQVAASFVRWLSDTSRRWLVVLDDLARADVIDGLLPGTGAGRVLITTRNPAALDGRALGVELGPFSRRDAMGYLVGRLTADPEQRRGAIDLVEDLGFQPLAIAQASAVIANSWITCADYREHFASRRRLIADSSGAIPPAAAVTWTMAADQAELLLPGGAARSCLAFAAFLGGHAIPVDVFTTAAGCEYMAGARAGSEPPPEPARSALSVLERVGLLAINGSSEPGTVQISPEVLAATRNAMPAGGQHRAATAAIGALLEAWPAGDQRTRYAQTMRASAESLLHAAGDSIWADGCPAVLIRAGQSLDAAGLTGPAVDYWRELAAISDRLLGPGHPDSLRLVENLASACKLAGRTDEAIAWHRRIVEDRARSFGRQHSLTLSARLSLGKSLSEAGDFGAALAVLEEAIAESERALGATSPDTLAIRDELAAVHLAAGDTEQSIRLQRAALSERERVQGAAHRDTIVARQKLAEAYLAAGRLKDCIAAYKRVLADREKVDGPDHRGTLHSSGALAAAYHQAGRMASAVEMYERTRARCERALGPDDPDTLAACVGLARGYYAVGRLGDAADLLRATVARCELVLPQGDSLTTSARESLAAIVGG